MSEFKTGALVMCLGGTPNPAHRQHAGTIHQIGRAARFQPLGCDTTWHLEPPTITDGCDLVWSKSHLRIIGDPSDDATDETLAWKPVPLPEIAPSLLPTKEQA